MLELSYLIFVIILLLGIGAIVAFCHNVIRNHQTRQAIVYARRILNAGQADSKEQFSSVYRQLATARNDLEAAKLWKKLDELKDLTGIPAAR
jgi:hypothetical protein